MLRYLKETHFALLLQSRFQTSALSQDLQEVAASKPIPQASKAITPPYFRLPERVGNLGCFPLDVPPHRTKVWLTIQHSCSKFRDRDGGQVILSTTIFLLAQCLTFASRGSVTHIQV